jgi:hypothetical protein
MPFILQKRPIVMLPPKLGVAKAKPYVQRCTKVDAFKGSQSRLQSYASLLNILCSILIEKTLV